MQVKRLRQGKTEKEIGKIATKERKKRKGVRRHICLLSTVGGGLSPDCGEALPWDRGVKLLLQPTPQIDRALPPHLIVITISLLLPLRPWALPPLCLCAFLCAFHPVYPANPCSIPGRRIRPIFGRVRLRRRGRPQSIAASHRDDFGGPGP